jgi:hypothetical protein
MKAPSFREIESRLRRLEKLTAKLPIPIAVKLSVKIPDMSLSGILGMDDTNQLCDALLGLDGNGDTWGRIDSDPQKCIWQSAVEDAIVADGIDQVSRYFLRR